VVVLSPQAKRGLGMSETSRKGHQKTCSRCWPGIEVSGPMATGKAFVDWTHQVRSVQCGSLRTSRIRGDVSSEQH
jgi:hypothetical protein